MHIKTESQNWKLNVLPNKHRPKYLLMCHSRKLQLLFCSTKFLILEVLSNYSFIGLQFVSNWFGKLSITLQFCLIRLLICFCKEDKWQCHKAKCFKECFVKTSSKAMVDGCFHIIPYPTGNYMFKVNNGSTKTKCEICSKLTIKLTKPCSSVSVNFEQVNAGRINMTWKVFFFIIHFILIWHYNSSNTYKYIRLIYAR